MYPVLFKIGPIPIHSYGLMIAIAYLVGLWIALKEANRKNIDSKLISDFAIYAIIFGILGARLAYVFFFDFKYYLTHPLEIVAIWQGGLVLYGGIFGGLLAGIWFIKRHRLNFWKFADTFAPSLIIGQAIGRIGCFLSGDGYGKPTQLPWGIRFPSDSLAGMRFSQAPVHPTQIYEMVLNLGIFFILWKMRKRKTFDGFMILSYLILYSIVRFFLEFVRGDTMDLWNNSFVSVAQLVSIVVIAVSLLIIPYLKKRFE